MSRIGKKPVVIPSGVEVRLEGRTVHVKGPKGELSFTHHERMELKIEDGKVNVIRSTELQKDRELHGVTRTLISNMIEGVTNGFEKKLEIIGVGYRAMIQGSKLVLSLGFSHPVNYDIPNGIQMSMDEEKKNILTIKGIDKQLLGQITAEIRSFRSPEPYKGKGIRYVGEYVRHKAGKSAAKEAA